jgi:hypothetical protein
MRYCGGMRPPQRFKMQDLAKPLEPEFDSHDL